MSPQLIKRLLIYAINALIIFIVIWRVQAIDNDKAPILFGIVSVVLIVINSIIGLLARLSKNSLYSDFWWVAAALSVSLVPVLVNL